METSTEQCPFVQEFITDSQGQVRKVILDTIANLNPIAADQLTLLESEYQNIQNLPIGQVGTVVEIYETEIPRYLIEFADLQGREYAMAILPDHEVLALHYELAIAS